MFFGCVEFQSIRYNAEITGKVPTTNYNPKVATGHLVPWMDLLYYGNMDFIMNDNLHPELRSVAAEMLLASKDYDENVGSRNAEKFWRRFERKRMCYRLKKKEIEERGVI